MLNQGHQHAITLNKVDYHLAVIGKEIKIISKKKTIDKLYKKQYNLLKRRTRGVKCIYFKDSQYLV